MQVEIIGVFIPIVAIISLAAAIIITRKYENAERLSMIDKGMNPKELSRESNTSVPLRFSLLFIGAGLGLFVGYFLDMAFAMEEVAYFSMLLIFGGLGLLGAYMLEEKKAKHKLSQGSL